MNSMQPKVCFFIKINQTLTKINKNKQIKTKQSNQFIYVQDNQEIKIKKHKVGELNH